MPESKNFLQSDEGQKLAIRHGTGPMLVLAGPGSGKTYVITNRIAHLISQCKIPPNHILVITFTKAAALEMQARANALLKECAYVQFGTFHSVFYQIFRLSNPHQKLTLASDQERISFIKAYLYKGDQAGKDVETLADHYLKAISRRKNRLPETTDETATVDRAEGADKTAIVDRAEGADEIAHADRSKEEFETVYCAYNEWLSENQRLDFDDMLRMCYLYLLKNPDERKKWQERFSYILIDEFQDINALQYETVKLLSDNGNLFAVGDDDQAIYGFRGADPFIMRQFVQEFGAKTVRLSYNYRCSGNITGLAAGFIAHNSERFQKEIQAVKEPGEKVFIKEMADRKEEFAFLEAEIRSYAADNPGKTQAVLTRTNGLLRGYEQLLNKKKGNPLWKDILAYLSFINCGRKREDFLQIMNRPMRYISRNIVSEPVICFSELKKRLYDKPWIGERMGELEKQTEFAARLDIGGQIHYIWKAMGYEKYIREAGNDDISKMKENTKWFSDLLSKAEDCKNLDELKAKMEDDLPENWEGQEGNISDNVRIMTYHGAKGLEFDRVYLPDLNYGQVPHGRMLTKEELEEERRMFYVALTRAKESLVLLHIKEQTISPFLTEIT